MTRALFALATLCAVMAALLYAFPDKHGADGIGAMMTLAMGAALAVALWMERRGW